MLNKVLDRIEKVISIEKFDGTKILIDTDDKLSENITLQNGVVSVACIIKDNGNFYSHLFLERIVRTIKDWQQLSIA